MMSSTISEDESGELMVPPDSPGSSVSTRLMDEYDELLRYAVVVPSFDPRGIPKSLADIHGSFPVNALLNIGQIQEQQRNGNMQDLEQEDYSDGDETSTIEDDNEGEPLQSSDAGLLAGGSLPESDSGLLTRDEPVRNDHQSARQSNRNVKLSDLPLGDPLATKLFMRPDPHSPRDSISGYSQTTDSEIGYSVTIDQDLSRMENLMDQWTGDLKRNVLAEFGQAKIKLISHHKHQAQRDREKHGTEVQRLHTEMDGLRELLHTYEQSIDRKDHVITNLTDGLQKQRQKFEMMRTFSEWKIKHNDMKREALAGKLADKHYYRRLQQKSLDAWHSMVESKWRQRVEKACQAKAQEVCMSLTNDYEAKISSLNEALEAARLEVNRLHSDREGYEETMKKAFMRGVCALNMEAMAMFHEDKQSEDGVDPAQQMAALAQAGLPPTNEFYSTPVQQEPVYSSEPPGAPPPRVVTSQGAVKGPIVSSKVITSQAKTAAGIKPNRGPTGKQISAKITARTEPQRTGVIPGGQLGLAPPMSSVVVERHQPVTKQTVGHATANRYVRTTDSVNSTGGATRPVIVQRKIAGQSGNVSAPSQNIQTIKVVD